MLASLDQGQVQGLDLAEADRTRQVVWPAIVNCALAAATAMTAIPSMAILLLVIVLLSTGGARATLSLQLHAHASMPGNS